MGAPGCRALSAPWTIRCCGYSIVACSATCHWEAGFPPIVFWQGWMGSKYWLSWGNTNFIVLKKVCPASGVGDYLLPGSTSAARTGGRNRLIPQTSTAMWAFMWSAYLPGCLLLFFVSFLSLLSPYCPVLSFGRHQFQHLWYVIVLLSNYHKLMIHASAAALRKTQRTSGLDGTVWGRHHRTLGHLFPCHPQPEPAPKPPRAATSKGGLGRQRQLEASQMWMRNMRGLHKGGPVT